MKCCRCNNPLGKTDQVVVLRQGNAHFGIILENGKWVCQRWEAK